MGCDIYCSSHAGAWGWRDHVGSGFWAVKLKTDLHGLSFGLGWKNPRTMGGGCNINGKYMVVRVCIEVNKWGRSL